MVPLDRRPSTALTRELDDESSSLDRTTTSERRPSADALLARVKETVRARRRGSTLDRFLGAVPNAAIQVVPLTDA
jgi:hypothetical protein